jgi:SAM-dependent methyltransferase
LWKIYRSIKVLKLENEMLKNAKLMGLLRSPDDPDGEPLSLQGDILSGAGWPVPIVNGIPDFVTYAPSVERSLKLRIPIDDKPETSVFLRPPIDEMPPAWFGEERRKYRILHKHPKGILLDAGCGQGNRATFEKIGYDYIGLDISFNSQQRCQGPADVDVVSDCHRLPFPSNSIEVVNSAAVLEHLYWPALALYEIYRVLVGGGLLIGSCSFLEGEHFDSQYHHSCLGLYRLIKCQGLEVLHIYPGSSLWESHSNSIYFSLPGHKLMGKLHRIIYLGLVKLKSQEPVKMRLLRHAAVLHFIAVKPS